ncbi:hypothetical protein ACTJJ7_16405 [Phyllobacterium sp. 22229]|uniref:hypothetical protein n=1 Tax=Phyllobacterium sp. 22229 TaxID=3453895 RepID=UPI003F85D745
MMRILGLDIATTTGFAWYEPGSPLSTICTGLIKASGENAEDKAASIAQQMVSLLRNDRPDFIAIEQPMRNVVSFKKTKQTLAGPVEENTINPNALQLSSITGAVIGIIAAYKIPWETIPSATWRKHFLGMGRSPGFDRAAWKRAAVERCRTFKIQVKNADAAEAVGIAMAGEACQRFKQLAMRAA